jgi:hypothetical protein
MSVFNISAYKYQTCCIMYQKNHEYLRVALKVALRVEKMAEM